MPVSEISKGVFIVAPRDLPKYKDTAAGQYTSVFTKQRADQWEMAQKQALMEMELGVKQYAVEAENYRARMKSLDDRKRALELAIVDVSEGRLKAEDAAKRAAISEATDRQRTAADWEAKKAERMTVSGGGTSVTVTSGEKTGGGGGAASKTTIPSEVSSGAQKEIATIEQSFADTDSLTARTAIIANASRSGGLIGRATESEGDRVAAVGTMGLRLAASEKARILRENPDMDPDEAQSIAEESISAAFRASDPVAAQEFDLYRQNVDTTRPAATGDGKTTFTSTTTSTRPGATVTAKRPGLGELPTAPTVEAPGTASDAVLLNTIKKQIDELEKERAAIARPTMGATDLITRSREVMQGRFGGFSGQPEALPYQQRNAADQLLRDQTYGLGKVQEYRDYLARQRAEAANVNRLSDAQADLTRAAAADILQSRRPSLLDGLAETKTPQIPEIAALNIPRKPTLMEPSAVTSVPPSAEAPVTPPPPVQSSTETSPQLPADIRPEAAALMTPDELAAFRARLMQTAADTQLRRDLAAIDMGGSEINPAFRVPLAPPPAPPRGVAPPQFTPTPEVAAPLSTSFNFPVYGEPSIGAKEEGKLNLSSPAMAPSTSGAAPRGPADVSAAVRPAGPLGSKLPSQVRAETERFTKSTEMAEDVRKATKAGIQPEAMGIKKGGPPSTVGYFQNRAEVALELMDKRGKLERLSASGPGKVARDMWSQNSKLGKPFTQTWQELQLTFAGDERARETAHEVALALDMIAKEDKAPPKQAPK